MPAPMAPAIPALPPTTEWTNVHSLGVTGDGKTDDTAAIRKAIEQNRVLYFPSGAVYPQESFPAWMQAIAVVDPFTYAVHGFKELVLKNTGLMAISFDLAFLLGFTVLTMGAATLLFRRTL